MAFTSAEKAQIRQVLGYSALFYDLDPRLEGQMDSLPTRDADSAARISANLVKLTALDARMECALDNLDAAVAGSMTLLGPAQLVALRAHGRMLIQQIAITLEVPVRKDYYAPGEASGVIALG